MVRFLTLCYVFKVKLLNPGLFCTKMIHFLNLINRFHRKKISWLLCPKAFQWTTWNWWSNCRNWRTSLQELDWKWLDLIHYSCREFHTCKSGLLVKRRKTAAYQAGSFRDWTILIIVNDVFYTYSLIYKCVFAKTVI